MKENLYKINTNDRYLHDIQSIVELVDSIIHNAYYKNSSDIHIDPTESGIVIRFRIDGVLTYIDTIKDENHQELISRIKIISGLRTDIHFIPQDGRFSFNQGTCECDIRVSIIPTHYGENAVLRILKKENDLMDLSKLGFSNHDIDRINTSLSFNQGMILVTGPTGSGKTSTLYTLISSLSSRSNSIITLEDPIEYAIPGVRQIQLHSHHGNTFSNCMRSIVRQDPDIIMVGEIRDTETAQIATNISLTGHLLLSTLHTNSSLGVIPRFFDMKIDSYLIASTLSLVIAQRLVRKICSECKGIGCLYCLNQGYKGRTVIAETLLIDEELRKYIMSHVSLSEINRYSKTKGFISMYEDGMDKVSKGITSREEVMRVINDK